MKLRKLFAVILALLVIFSFAGCGGGGGGGSDDPSGGGGGGNGGEAETAPNYLCFTAAVNSTIRIEIVGNISPELPVPALEWSKDRANWNAIELVEDGLSSVIPIYEGEKVYLRGDNTSFSRDYYAYVRFVMTGSIAASGNIMSLLDKTCKSVTIPSEGWCFYGLFEDCDVLSSAPELPATTLKDYCYMDMFFGCTALTAAPDLPATTLKERCYSDMFYGCSALTSIKVYFTDWKDEFEATTAWVYGVDNSNSVKFYYKLGLDVTTDYDSSHVLSNWDFIQF